MRNLNLNFSGHKKVFLGIALGTILLTLLASIFIGVKLDIQFKGGALITYSYEGEVDRDEFQTTVANLLGETVTVQESVDVQTGIKKFVVSMAAQKGISMDKQLELAQTLSEKYAANKLDTAEIHVVDPTIGSEFLMKSLLALAFASLLMIAYISLRFKKISGWSAGVTAVIALLHDVVMVFAAFIVLGFAIDANFIAVSLTILGYSLSDTIVIYDRIRENKRIYGKEMAIDDLVNLSLNQSLKRSLMTSITTVSAMVVVTVVALLYNVSSILSFSLPMIVGMVAGSYSSLCLAPNLWIMWQNKKAATEQ